METRAARWERRFDWIVMVAAALVVPIIAVEQSHAGHTLRTLATIGNWAIWLVFLAEVVVLLSIVENKKRWLLDHPLDVAIVVLTPPFLPASLQSLRVFRLLRLLRLIRVVQAARRLFSPQGLKWAALLALITAFCGGAAFAAVEEGHNPKVHDTWDGVWWSISTMSTVGYGDITPMTDTGRMIAVVVMVVGIGFLTLLIGGAAEGFVSKDAAKAQGDLRNIEQLEADVLTEIHEISTRLQSLEANVRRLRSG
jgi:voltage-gated potassium channel